MSLKILVMIPVIFFGSFIFSQEKMRVYTFYTDSHAVLKDKWFLPTFIETNSDLELIIKHYDQECLTGTWGQNGWNTTMFRKVELILQAIEENWGKIFIYADIDIQFFRPMKWTIEKEIEGYDMVIQRDGPGEGELCAGFFACQANEAVKELWLKVHEIMKADAKRDDQQPLNHLLKGRATKVRWKRLPNDFLSGGTLHTELWVPGKIIPAPVTVILHHANWTFGIDNKLAQLKQVRETVQEKKLKMTIAI